MRRLILSAAMAALLVPFTATGASAQPFGWGNRGGYDHRVQREMRECQRELRRANSRRAYERERRECRREISQARRDSRSNWSGDRHGYRGW
jgi:hypothetical protein